MKRNYLYLLLILTVFSCSKKEFSEPESVCLDNEQHSVTEYTAYDSNTVQKKGSGNNLPYYNDIDILSVNRLKVKLNGGTSYQFDNFNNQNIFRGYVDEITRLDAKKEDGWVVLYNFIPHNLNEPLIYPMVILYNQYRGTLKLMYHHMQNSESHGGSIFASLSCLKNSPVNTSLFNGSNQIIDPDTRTSGQVVSMSTYSDEIKQITGLNREAWYAFEWDVSYYDTSIANAKFRLQIWGSDVQDIYLTGDINGNIAGSIKVGVKPGQNTSLFNDKKISDLAVKEGTSAVMKLGGNKLADFFSTKHGSSQSWIGKQVFGLLKNKDIISAGASAILGPIAGFATKTVSKFLGKFFPGKPATPIYHSVNLKANLKANFTGKIKKNISTPPVVISYQNNPLGIFSLHKKPRIKVSEGYFKMSDLNNPRELSNYRYRQNYNLLDGVTETVAINPALLNIATVEKKFTMVCIDKDNNIYHKAYKNKLSEYSILFSSEKTDGTIYSKDIMVKDAGSSLFAGIIFDVMPDRYATDYEFSHPKSDKLLYIKPINLYVRLNLVIKPKNGDAPVAHTYYIQPNYIEDQAYVPFPKKMSGGFPDPL